MKVSCLWKDLCRLYWGNNGEGFRSDFIKISGKGENTLFWFDRWGVDGESLKTKFLWLFNLSCQKNAKIGRWSNNIWIWDLKWNRELSSRNKDQFDIYCHLLVVALQNLEVKIDGNWDTFQKAYILPRLLMMFSLLVRLLLLQATRWRNRHSLAFGKVGYQGKTLPLHGSCSRTG